MYSYSLDALGAMVGEGNRHRVDAYLRAMEQAIGPNSVVLEIGTGIGFFAMLAARMGPGMSTPSNPIR